MIAHSTCKEAKGRFSRTPCYYRGDGMLIHYSFSVPAQAMSVQMSTGISMLSFWGFFPPKDILKHLM